MPESPLKEPHDGILFLTSCLPSFCKTITKEITDGISSFFVRKSVFREKFVKIQGFMFIVLSLQTILFHTVSNFPKGFTFFCQISFIICLAKVDLCWILVIFTKKSAYFNAKYFSWFFLKCHFEFISLWRLDPKHYRFTEMTWTLAWGNLISCRCRCKCRKYKDYCY